ncbi:MAG TPA: thioredoxin family protein [Bacillota bacterium]|nr:thioredoxin family protein [Bacillota bacterium]
MEIKVLGPGCSKCKVMTSLVEKAIKKLGLNEKIILVKDFEEILSYGVMSTPVLIVDGEIKISGRIGSLKEIMAFLDK